MFFWMLDNARVSFGLACRFCSDKIETFGPRFPCQRIQSHLRLGRQPGFALHFAKRQPRFAARTTFPTTRIVERVSPCTIRSRSAARQVGSASGGTSAGSPQWAALLAISNSMRVANRKTRLSGANTVLYSLSKQSAAANFHPITADTNGSCGALCTASAGGDYVTRIGKSAAASLVNTLAAQYRSRFGLQWVGQLPRMESGELPTTEAEAVLAASRCAAAGF